VNPASPLKNVLVLFFNLAKLRAEFLAARKITTYVTIFTPHPCGLAAYRENQQAATVTHSQARS